MKVVIPVGTMPVDNYVQALNREHAEAVAVHEAPMKGTDGYDGLLLPGGWDIDPALYHQKNEASAFVDPSLDAMQMKWLDAFVRAQKPVLGICRGHQLINVYFNGTLIQDLVTKNRHAKKRMEDPDQYHMADVCDHSFLIDLYGTSFLVNSSHHQAVDQPGEGMLPALYSHEDHVLEASQNVSLPIWTVQWHPERCLASYGVSNLVNGDKLFAFFLSQIHAD